MFNEWSDIETQLRQNGFDVGAVKRELIHGWDLEQNLAGLRQKQIAGKVNTIAHTPIPGLGQCVARIDSGAFFYWAMREGNGCWQDKGFVREYIRDNPEVRVNQA